MEEDLLESTTEPATEPATASTPTLLVALAVLQLTAVFCTFIMVMVVLMLD